MGSPGGVGGSSDSAGSSGGDSGGPSGSEGSGSGGVNDSGSSGHSGSDRDSDSSSSDRDHGSFADAMDAAVNDALGRDDSASDDGDPSSTSMNGRDNNFGYAGEFDGLGSTGGPVGIGDDDDSENNTEAGLNGRDNNFGYAGEFDGLGPTGAPVGTEGTTDDVDTNSLANNFGYLDEFTGLTPPSPTTDLAPTPMVGFVGPLPATPAPPPVAPPATVPTAPPANLPTAPPANLPTAPATPSLLGRALTWAGRLSPVGVFAAVTLTPTNAQVETVQIDDNTRLSRAPGDLFGRVETLNTDGSWSDTGISAAPAYDDVGNVIGLSNPSPNLHDPDEFQGLPTPEIAPPAPATVEPPAPAVVEPPAPGFIEAPEPATIEPGIGPETTAPTGPDATPPGITAPTPDVPPDVEPTSPDALPGRPATAPPEVAPSPVPEIAPTIPSTIEPPVPATSEPPSPARVEPVAPPQVEIPSGPDATPPGVPAPADPDIQPGFPDLPISSTASDAPSVDPSSDDNDDPSTSGDDSVIREGQPVTPTGTEGAQPDGQRTRIGENNDPETKRSLTRENESADALADRGYRVEQNPSTDGRVRRDGSPNPSRPDYRIEGEYFDSYAPGTGANGEPKSVRGVWSEIDDKVNVKEQADRIVLNLNDWAGDVDDLRQQFEDYPIEHLEEVIVIRDGEVFNL